MSIDNVTSFFLGKKGLEANKVQNGPTLTTQTFSTMHDPNKTRELRRRIAEIETKENH